MSFAMWAESWYGEKISQSSEEQAAAGASKDALAVAHGIMVAGAMIAQAIDFSIGPGETDGSTIKNKMDSLIEQIQRLADDAESRVGG